MASVYRKALVSIAVDVSSSVEGQMSRAAAAVRSQPTYSVARYSSVVQRPTGGMIGSVPICAQWWQRPGDLRRRSRRGHSARVSKGT